jgi:glycosyltransferase involved in cell wall biosynthesis
MGNKQKQPLLSICIPTWNRVQYLQQSLELFKKQLQDIEDGDVELFVSDNCSLDNTKEVVYQFIEQGVPINYNRNEENIGAARNFIKCIQWAKGQYIWLLGDDDFLLEGSLQLIVNVLKNGDYGLVHLKQQNKDSGYRIIDAKELFFKEVSYWSTFMSANIFTRDFVFNIDNVEQYIPTHLLQVPFYLYSAVHKEKNVIVYQSILDTAKNSSDNGGYNFFDVFVNSYLDIWEKFVDVDSRRKRICRREKKQIYIHFILYYTYKLLIKKENASTKEEETYSRKGWRTNKGWSILFKHYKYNLYFYVYMIKFFYWGSKDCVKFLLNNRL